MRAFFNWFSRGTDEHAAPKTNLDRITVMYFRDDDTKAVLLARHDGSQPYKCWESLTFETRSAAFQWMREVTGPQIFVIERASEALWEESVKDVLTRDSSWPTPLLFITPGAQHDTVDLAFQMRNHTPRCNDPRAWRESLSYWCEFLRGMPLVQKEGMTKPDEGGSPSG